MKITLTAAALSIALLLTASQASAQLSIEELSTYVPDTANTVAVVRIKKILSTERAIKEEWSVAHNNDFLGGVTRIPPWVDSFVMGSLVHPDNLQEDWTVAALNLPKTIGMEQLARHSNSPVEQLAGRSIVRGQTNSLLIELKSGILGVVRPAYRQYICSSLDSLRDGKEK